MNISDIITGESLKEIFSTNPCALIEKKCKCFFRINLISLSFFILTFFWEKISVFFKISKKGFIFSSFLIISLLIFSGCAGIPNYSTKLQSNKKVDTYVRVVIFRLPSKLLVEGEKVILTSTEGSFSLPSVCGISIQSGFALVNGVKRSLPFSIKSPNSIYINRKEFYGYVEFMEDIVLNIIPIEDYLRGVLPSEMSPKWPLEALKAQAIVSRTYVVKRILESKNRVFDVDNTEMYQMFNYGETDPIIEDAVKSTEGTIILYRGEPIEAFFHSCSGGKTESCRDIFQQDLNYLRSVPDPYSNKSEQNSWSFTVESEKVKESILQFIEQENKEFKLLDIKIKSRTASGRVSAFLLLFEQNKQQIIAGNTFRLALGPKELKSLLIKNINRSVEGEKLFFTFTGTGYGHGVGMSQWGAKEMASLGFSYKKIIAYYYRGTTLGRLENLAI